MAEARGRTIPLRRRSGVVARTESVEPAAQLSLGARALRVPSRQLWLVTLGATAVTVRAAHALWTQLVAEGEEAERWLLGPSVTGPDRD